LRDRDGLCIRLGFLELDDHLACNPGLPNGCDRCRPLPLTDCCDLCSLDAFKFFHVAPPADAPRPRQRYGINKYKPTEKDDALHDALHAYCKQVCCDRFGSLQYGAGYWMPDIVFERILGLSHYRKLVSIEEFAFELSDWPPQDVAQYGTAILELVNQHLPQPLPVALVAWTDTADDTTRKVSAPPTCSMCVEKGKDGHGHKCKFFLLRYGLPLTLLAGTGVSVPAFL
jgi:hypothetical protein